MSAGREEFWDLIRTVLPEATISNFVLICEIQDSDQPSLKVVTSEMMTPWLADGMISFASDMIFGSKDTED